MTSENVTWDNVAYYNFKRINMAFLHDVTGNGNDGTLINMADNDWISGKPGLSNALDFDGVNDYVSTGYGNGVNFTGSGLSIQAWVYSRDLDDASGLVSARGAGSGANSEYIALNLGLGNQTPCFSLFYRGTFSTACYNTNISLNAWTHLAGTYDGNTVTIYVNGEGVSTPASGQYIATDNFKLGWDDFLTTESLRYFNGKLGEVGIWNRGLSAREITNLYNGGVGLVHPNPVAPPSTNETLPMPSENVTFDNIAYYNFDENSGTILPDVTGNGKNGMLMNSPNWVSGKSGLGNALSFDGVDDWVDMQYDIQNLAPSGTLAFWIRPNRSGSASAGNSIMGMEELGANSGNWEVYSLESSNSRNVEWLLENSSSDNYLRSNTKFPLNTWAHVVLMWGDGMKFYVNGKLQPATNTGTNAPKGPWAIGRIFQTVNLYTYYDGVIDEVGIWNRSLSQGEIDALYNNGDGLMYFEPPSSKNNPGPLNLLIDLIKRFFGGMFKES